MGAHTLTRQFRHVASLASLAYIFSGIHALQYSLLASDYNSDMDDNSEDHNQQESALTSNLDLTSAHDTSNHADTSSNSGRASGRWTDQEINLLLDYVEAHCHLNMSRGLSLKRSQFNKARDMIKSKDASQCHYKWGHVRIHIINVFLSY